MKKVLCGAIFAMIITLPVFAQQKEADATKAPAKKTSKPKAVEGSTDGKFKTAKTVTLPDPQRNKVMQATEEIKSLTSNIRSMFGEKTDAYKRSKYRGLNNRIAVEKNLVPETLLGSIKVNYASPKALAWGYTLINGWNGAVTIASAPEEFGHKYFHLTYSGLPQGACVGLLTNNWGDEFLGHVFTCANAKCFAWDKALSEQKPPISEKEAMAICAGGGYVQIGFR